MLTVLVQNYNTFTQEFYDSVISNLQFHQLECTCHHSGCLTIHGYYERSVITPNGKVRLAICRVRCSECGHTHAILLSSLVPYSQISLENQREIVSAYEDGVGCNNILSSGEGVDENNIKSVIRRYVSFWRERLIAVGISLNCVINLIQSSFSFYSMQFMQIRSTVNILFLSPT